MRRFYKILVLLCFALVLNVSTSYSSYAKSSYESSESQLYNQLKALPNVVSVQKMDVVNFKEKYKVVISQLVDPKNPKLGSFNQRFFVFHQDFSKPVVMVTEGYTATSSESPKRTEEISTKLGCNLIVVEHRYFAESVPDASWKHMTGFNAAHDLHRINQEMRTIYNNKFITTGISKGGQTTILYKTYFPEDSDIAVPYVAPICFNVEDGRHEPFLANIVGTPEDRAKILELQKEVLRRKSTLVPMLAELTKEKGYEFEDMSLDAVLDYCVLEFPFAFWQWGEDIDKLPALDAPDQVLFDRFVKSSGGAEYIANMGDTAPFYVQAAQDLGYYGYDVKPFKGLLSIKNAEGYLKNIFLPVDFKNAKFSHKLHKDIYKYLENNDPKMLSIYGEWDPWSAAAPKEYLFDGKSNMRIYFDPAGSHKARIATLPQEMQDEIWGLINKWLAE